MPIWMCAAASSRPGRSRSRPRGAPLPTNTASQPPSSSARMLSMRLPGAELDAHVQHVAHFLVDDRIGQAELGNLRAHHAAGLGIAVEHHAFVTERREIARDRQRRRSGAHQRDPLAVLGSPRAWAGTRPDVFLVIGGDPLQAADRHRLRLGFVLPCSGDPPRCGRGGTRARTDDRRCGRECRGTRSTSS